MGFNLSMPVKRVSAWMAETDPKYARAWLASLPLADSAETAREIYQALYTLNRQELDAIRRFELMELYSSPVATVTAALEPYFARAALPLTPKKRQLAEFIRQLHIEMAYGYKGCLQDFEKQRLRWTKKSLRMASLARAMHYLGEVLLHSYQVYMPFPTNTWREIHAIYRFAAEQNMTAEVIDAPPPESGKTTLGHDYIKILLLGLSNPYQLPQNECRYVQRFLHHWGAKAVLRNSLEPPHPGGHFLLDVSIDSPPVPFPRDAKFKPEQDLRLLDASELLHTLQFFIQRLKKGDRARALSLGIDCLDSICLEMLQRMLKSWGLIPRRQYSRIQRSGPIFLCAGLPAIHFFANGQKPFTPPEVNRNELSDEKFVLPEHIEQDIVREAKSKDEEFIALDEPVAEATASSDVAPESFQSSAEELHVDRWQIKDTAPRGLQLIRRGESHTYLRIGDVVGVQQVNDIGHWSAGVVRWMKSPDVDKLEMGIELLSSNLMPAAVALARGAVREYRPGLILPAIETLHQPATLLVPRGVYATGNDLWLAQEAADVRLVRLLQRFEHTSMFELFVFADVLT